MRVLVARLWVMASHWALGLLADVLARDVLIMLIRGKLCARQQVYKSCALYLG